MLLAMLMLSCYMEAAAVNPNSKEQASDCAVGRMQNRTTCWLRFVIEKEIRQMLKSPAQEAWMIRSMME